MTDTQRFTRNGHDIETTGTTTIMVRVNGEWLGNYTSPTMAAARIAEATEVAR